MKRSKLLSLFLIASLFILFTSCGDASSTSHADASGDGQTEEVDGSSHSDKKLSGSKLSQNSRNIFENSMMILTGTIMNAFSQAFGGIAEGLGEALEGSDVNVEKDGEKLDVNEELSKGANKLSDEMMGNLKEVQDEMTSKFDSLQQHNPEVYEKMFGHDVMKKGVEIANKYDLPKGFKRLSEDMSMDDIQKYVSEIGSNPDELDEDSPIGKTLKEIFEWFEEVSETFENDPELNAVLKEVQN